MGYTNGTAGYVVYGADVSIAAQQALSSSPNSFTRINGDMTPYPPHGQCRRARSQGTIDDIDGHQSIGLNNDPTLTVQGGLGGNNQIPLGVVISPGYPNPTTSAATACGDRYTPAEATLAVQSITPLRDGFVLQFNQDFFSNGDLDRLAVGHRPLQHGHAVDHPPGSQRRPGLRLAGHLECQYPVGARLRHADQEQADGQLHLPPRRTWSTACWRPAPTA